jgi:hypothetical protein
MDNYGTVETIYRPLGIGVIRNKENKQIIFTAGSVKGGEQGFQDLEEGERGTIARSMTGSARSESHATYGRCTIAANSGSGAKALGEAT